MNTILDLDELLSWVAASGRWREKPLGAKADLRRADLNRADLREADLNDEIRSGAREDGVRAARRGA